MGGLFNLLGDMFERVLSYLQAIINTRNPVIIKITKGKGEARGAAVINCLRFRVHEFLLSIIYNCVNARHYIAYTSIVSCVESCWCPFMHPQSSCLLLA